jgi:hypothetical protein
MPRCYVYPRLGRFDLFWIRIGGRGLGNLLFTFARAIVLSKKYNLEIINPTWNSIKLGPLLRGESDTRSYNDLFDKPIGLVGFRKFFLLLFSKKRDENELSTLVANGLLDKSSTGALVIECKGHDSFFADLIGYRSHIRNCLYSILTDVNKSNIKNHDLSDGIVVHIRMGDFQAVPSDLSQIKPWLNYRLPINWYINIIDKIRAYSGRGIPVYVFSDGTSDELTDILSMENTFRVQVGNSISDILALSSGAVMIGSGSSFSMWAAFLGGMPSIWYPNLHSSTLLEDQSKFEGEIDFNDNLPKKLLANLTSIFSDV